jgi:hypothetical protein
MLGKAALDPPPKIQYFPAANTVLTPLFPGTLCVKDDPSGRSLGQKLEITVSFLALKDGGSALRQHFVRGEHAGQENDRRPKEAFNQLQGHRDHESAEAALRVKRVLGGVRLCRSGV